MPNESEPLTNCEIGRVARISLTTVYSLMCVFGTVLNLVVIYLVVSFKKLRTASNAFIVNGCVADLLVCAFWMPHEAVAISTGNSLVLGYHAFKEALLLIGITVSLLSHSLVAVNRYVLITKTPATYQSLYQKRHTEWMIVGSWLISLGSLLPWFTSFRYPTDICRDAQDATVSFSKGVSVLSNPLAAGTLALTIIGQTVVVLYCYFKIFRRVQISVKRVSILNFQIVNNLPYSFPRKDKRLGFYVLAVCFIFMLTTGPIFWTLTTGLFIRVSVALWTSSWIIFCTIFVSNPFLYTWKNEEFRKSFRSIMRGDFWRGSTVGVEPITINTISHIFPRQNSRRAFLGDMN
ncbi:probable G-protein coupled receptor 88 [Electrophorus electricus]|uniref:probable G-protein coupled receptor 88 n=1 Tax=Electrophorus electricus TaxID=8005 RepID=UPI000F09B716|nr:probable G-protein coupled receptor 88 [Electrophorus electricus]